MQPVWPRSVTGAEPDIGELDLRARKQICVCTSKRVILMIKEL